MKKKFDFKLTAILVSLFIGFLLIILGNKNKYCLSFGFIMLGVSIILYSVDKRNRLKKLIIEYDEAMSDIEDVSTLIELGKQRGKLEKQKNFTCLMFFLFGALIIIGGFVGLL